MGNHISNWKIRARVESFRAGIDYIKIFIFFTSNDSCLQSWRICYYVPGAITVIFGVMFIFVLDEPERTGAGANDNQIQNKQNDEDVSLCEVLLAPSFVLFCIGGCLRQCGSVFQTIL